MSRLSDRSQQQDLQLQSPENLSLRIFAFRRLQINYVTHATHSTEVQEQQFMLHMTKILQAPFTVHLTNVPFTNYNKLLNQFLHFFELFDSLPAFFLAFLDSQL